MKYLFPLILSFLLLNVQNSKAACTHAANNNCANAIALVVNASPVSGVTCGTLEAGELVDCADVGTTQSVWYSFVATDTQMSVTIVSNNFFCGVSSAIWGPASACPPTAGCEALSCHGAKNAIATTVHVLDNLAVGATYKIQIMFAPGGFCGQDASFTVQVTTAMPANPTNPLPLSTCTSPSGTACVFNYNADVTTIVATCTPYNIPAPDTSGNNVIKSCFSFVGQYNTDISFSAIITSNCDTATGNVNWLDWEIQDSACNAIACGNLDGSLSYSGIKCGSNYNLCYTWEIPICDETNYYPFITAIPPTFTATSSTGPSTTGTSLALSVCHGDSATISAHATGYTTFIWSPAAGLNKTSGSPVIAKPDTTTTYTLTGYDAGGCSQTKTITVTVNPAPTATITPPTDTLTCTNTSLMLTAGGGGTYKWSTNATTAGITVTTANTYTVTVTGTNTCKATTSVTVAQNVTPPLASVNPPSAALSCGTSSVTLTASGGNSYTWNTTATTDTINVTSANTYTVTATGANGCTAAASATVTNSGGTLSLTPASTAATCGNANGTASVTSSGAGPFHYAWNTTDTTQTITNLTQGNYSVTVTGQGGCSATTSVSVSTTGGLVLNAVPTAASCGNANGTASVIATSGTGPFHYAWSTTDTTQTISNLTQGNYSVTVTGQGGCSATTSVSVSATGGLAVAALPSPTTCGNANGSATTNITGTGPYSYSWSNNTSNPDITNVPSGPYQVTVTGAGGCTGSATVNIAASTGVSATASATSTNCGSSTGSVSVNATGGGGSYTYNWSNSIGTTQTVNNLPAGNYSVTVTGGNCTATANTTVTAVGTGTVAIASNKTTAICYGDTATICAPTTGYAHFEWNTGDTTACISTTYTGNYYLTATDNNNCMVTSNHIDVTNFLPSPVTISVNGDSLSSYSENGYQWYLNGQPLAGDTSASIVATQSGSYTVQITDVHGCPYLSAETVIDVTAINHLGLAGGISVYPNPLSSGSWHINVTDAMIGATCQVFDANGQVVYKNELKTSNSEISLNVAPGVYLMQIQSADMNYNLKLIKLY